MFSTSAVPGVNYLPLTENITFVPNKATLLCINLTILIDKNSAVENKLLTLFVITEDGAVNVILNMTIVNIYSLRKHI